MVPKSPTIQALMAEANRNVLRNMDAILEQWDKVIAKQAPPRPGPKTRAAVAKKRSAKKK